ncbi:hypothetical protein PF005_g1321 [Phytophthora fragariae]|uniref:Ubiquitin-like protease family profile domain-containing protein n=2 Tax=Phytophthora fragariae TaxID=53985 RepID=A0A6A3UUE5_9STRA|nr:hypothetical protein PF010_g1052 [Phytophthora fragariae]KAE9154935.1 hypothetical protein PF006_g1053 [Phytophthora fragariae]KAE9235800.1 hypothetical protein PF005_g1321 [Phytophthora fragariae]KAE9254556.1 hypothetical protein PF004_g973 [Phytophthora fragariae]
MVRNTNRLYLRSSTILATPTSSTVGRAVLRQVRRWLLSADFVWVVQAMHDTDVVLDGEGEIDVDAVLDEGKASVGTKGTSVEKKKMIHRMETIPLIGLNGASRASGRPREQVAAKKARMKVEFDESQDLAIRLTTIGDVTLDSFKMIVQQGRLSLGDVEDVFDGLRPMHSDAVFKRPKARLLDGSSGEPESNVRGVLPVALVNKCLTSIKNLKARAKSSSGTVPHSASIAVVILKVGMFRATDIETMNEWHSISRMVTGARSLMSWAKTVQLDEVSDIEKRKQILETVKTMDMRASINYGGNPVDFAELARFGDEGWLSDQCLVSAATHIAVEASHDPAPTIYVINPTVAQFKEDEQRNKHLDTKNLIFSRCHDGLAILCPIFVDTDFGHWCGAIFDIKRRVVWVYDPFHKKQYEDEVEQKVKDVFFKLVDPAYKLQIR